MAGLEGRTALVTGGGRGIGRAICVRLATDGADVAINYANNVEAANEVAEAVRTLGRRAEVYRADVADRAAVDAMCVDLGRIDILVNNAGLGSAYVNRPAITTATSEQYQTLLGANLWGPIHTVQALVPQMREAERGDVVMISSVATDNMAPGFGLYALSKAALEAMAHTLAKEERSNGIRVNIVAPGLVDTDMGKALISALTGQDEVDMRDRDEGSPFGYVCAPSDIAATVAHLVSEDGRYITNQKIRVNGGGF
jgi:NAD(P)-dependent dehydrogenase (short-subunit alcohol dehydrogenase family)